MSPISPDHFVVGDEAGFNPWRRIETEPNYKNLEQDWDLQK
jgi:hypothetical protein